MNKWRKCNWYFLLSLCLYTFLLTSCSTIKLRSLIPSLANDQTQNKIEKSLLDEKLRNKDKEITELRASLNTLNELKTKVINKNNEISRLKKELNRITNLNNSQTNQISRLKNESKNPENSNNTQENEITRLKNELDQTINSIQARILEEIEESRFFDP